MSDLPRKVEIAEEGPREGFQIEKNPIPSANKIALIDALSATGLRHIQVASFVSPKLVPGWADAEAVVAGLAGPCGCAAAFWHCKVCNNTWGLTLAWAPFLRVVSQGLRSCVGVTNCRFHQFTCTHKPKHTYCRRWCSGTHM